MWTTVSRTDHRRLSTGGRAARTLKFGAATLCLAAVSVTTGCGGENTGSESSVTVATSSNGLSFLPIMVAEENGYYKDAGLNVTQTSVKGGSTGLSALAGGSAQFYAGLPESLISASAAGSEAKIISALTQTNDYKIVSSSGIDSLSQLSGKKFGMLNEGNGTDVQPKQVLDDAGVGSESVQFIASGSVSDRLSALEAGQIDATILNTPFEFQAEEAGFNTIADLSDEVDDYPAQVIMSGTKTLEDKPETVKEFLKATNKATKFINENPDEVTQIAVESTGIEKNLVQKGLKEFISTKHYSESGEVSDEGLEWASKTLSNYTDQNIPADLDDLVDLSYLPGGES
ncbi:ABC transporter substrate-binding protein [Brevibacterium oceani]|uniref:ABC transporter substrate-binding protein n=1 Tax=Brevibacterium oceani TaxID=358099 RepID=UPI001B31C451|nr:ABC transporter substrate-binding protein [Brevibacterium oceani]